jgi:hypothetical protein
MRVEVVDDHIQAPTPRIAAQPAEGDQHILCGLATPTGAHQTIPMRIVETQELLGPLSRAVRKRAAGEGGPAAPVPEDAWEPPLLRCQL